MGAYEAGVLLYVLDELQSELQCQPRFNVFTGTSVGALNASFAAAHAQQPAESARGLVRFWESLRFESVLRFGNRELTSLFKFGLGAKPKASSSALADARRPAGPAQAAHPPVAGLFDTTPLWERLDEAIPWTTLQQNLAQGTVRGMAFCATEVCTGNSAIFYQTSKDTHYRRGTDPSKDARRVQIGLEHAMASAAMPFVFPSVQINGICYTDGSLRQNTPLNPALRMGASRVLVISLKQDPKVAATIARIGCRRNAYPGPMFLLGKTLDAFLNQSLDYELSRVEMYNKLISGGCKIYGNEFLDNLNRIVGDHRNASFRPVRTCHIRPSQDPHTLAIEALQQSPQQLSLPGIAGKAIEKLLRSEAFVESDLFSFLMFLPSYIRTLIDLGYHDARAHKQSLIDLFSDLPA